MTLIIYAFRAKWGEQTLSYSRYDVFPTHMLSLLYCLILSPWIKKIESPQHKIKTFCIYLILFSLISISASFRYSRAEYVAKETQLTVQFFQLQFSHAFENYFKNKPSNKILHVKNATIHFPFLNSLATRKKILSKVTRYSRTLIFYSEHLLDKKIQDKIQWGEKTDAEFIHYLQTNNINNQYSNILEILR
ncbi:hypothetical protein MNBD_UNCLBAC01-1455 [hydrothermal vent metagenome]|uniref:Uncharacterized protein n=1 Tax=hydrothermal vent metagenome TaxID=652676 RepID=A0A3B1CXV0_9ZZZZ